MNKLLGITGALAYLAAVFLNAFVDLGHKIIIQNTIFKIYDGQEQVILTAVVNGLILLPYILLLSPAGFVSDKYPKSRVMKLSAWAAVVLTLAITLCYYNGLFWPAFGLTFLLAIQSAFYSPAKYGYIKPLFGKEALAQGNALVQATTIVAILAGTLVYSIFFEGMYDESATTTGDILKQIAPLGWLLVVNAIFELLAMYRLPLLENGEPEKQFSVKGYFTGQLIKENLSIVTRKRVIRLSIIGLATFWSVGQVMLAAFPAYAKANFDVTNTMIIQGILACTGVGIVFGSWIAGRSSKNHIEVGLIPVGALGIALGLWFLPDATTPQGQALTFLIVGFMGGLFIVPLNALIQFYAGEHEMGRILAVNNWVQNISMASFLVITVVVSTQGFDSRFLLNMIAVVAVVGCFYTVFKLPHSMVRVILTYLMSRRYSINVQGLKNLPGRGGVLLLGNHISWIDWAIVQIASPRPVRFVMLKNIYEKWYLNWFLKRAGCIPISQGGSRKALENVTKALNDGEVVCIFPEGTISRTGHLAEFRRGYELACIDANDDVVIVPFYLRGLWGSQFSRSSAKLKRQRATGLQRDLVVALGKPLDKNTKADVLKRSVFDLSAQSWATYVQSLPTIHEAWFRSAKRMRNNLCIGDTLSGDFSPIKALTGAITLSKRIASISVNEKNIGLLVPTSAGGMLANMGALMAGKTVVNLNYTAGAETLFLAVQQADVKTIYTSKRFIEKLKKRGQDLTPLLETSDVIYLEELQKKIGKAELLFTAAVVKTLPARALIHFYCKNRNAAETAAILFSSGSEGTPKGVMLSHHNIMANLKQASDVLNMDDRDVIMASLPLFHAFGLTVTQFMPLVEGLPVIAHADPTDALGISKAVANYNATVMCGTSTFLRLFARNKRVHPLMLKSLRIVVAGAERLNPEVRDAFQGKFGKQIFEGYGCTETTPVASVNLPDALDKQYWQVQRGGKIGTVGMPLPGTSSKIVNPETFEELPTGEAGMILIGGVQVMQGYLKNPEKTNEVIKEIDGRRWYVTGDKGLIDDDGFLTIKDRYSRFAKLGGEMISLGAVEEQVKACAENTELEVVAVNIPEPKKGEEIVLLHDADLDSSQLKKAMLENGSSALTIPSKWLKVEEIPKLGSGKTDFGTAKKIALA